MTKILAICIPTYNRCNLLKRTINSILCQLDDTLKNNIDIYIFDNCSVDNTKEYCMELVDNYDFIKYDCKEKNVGADRNFASILSSKINAKYIHLMSDDDVYTKDCLKDLYIFLKNNDCPFVYLNLCYFTEEKYDENFKHETLSHKTGNFNNLSKKEFIKIIGNEVSFLSGMVFNTKYININNTEQYYGSLWYQTYALFLSCRNSNHNLGFFGKITIAKRNVDNPTFDLVKVFGKNYLDLMVFSYEHCNFNKKQMRKLVQSRWIKLLYDFKLKGYDSIKYKILLEQSKNEKFKRVLLFNKIPTFIFRIYHFIKYLGKDS